MRDVLPDKVVESIKQHLRCKADEVWEEVWASSNEDEDSLTGDFFGNLRAQARSEHVGDREYRWSVTYRKLRGRGPNAAEHSTGADGIFEVEVEDVRTGEMVRKSLPFQAKKQWRQRDGRLVEQVRQMEQICSGASGVFDYSPRGFTAIDGRAVLDSDGRPSDHGISAGDYLGRVVECESGSRSVVYDASRGLLLVKERAFRMPIRHRLRVSVEKR